MPSDWIRPAGCESGSCVEYRTVGDKVFVRNSSDLTDNGMLVFTVAEWDTFVAGLKDERLLDAEARAESLAADLDKAQALFRASGDTVAGLERDLAKVTGERDRALAAFESLEKTTAAAINGLAAETSRADSAWDTAQAWHGQWVRAQAKVEVLRHRDRRTQAVVEAAVAWAEVEATRTSQTQESSIWLTELAARAKTLLAAVDAYEKAPTEPLPTPQSDEQPPVEDTATGGLEAQGGAQQAAEVSWKSPIHTTSPDETTGWQAIRGLIDASSLGMVRPPEPDGEVPEAARAGEAQTTIDEAISDGYRAWLNAAGSNVRDRFAAGLHAATPLIERAALQAAEDALGEEVDNANEPSDREALMHACDVVRRLRATRTGGA